MGGDHEIAAIEPSGFRPGRWLTGRGWWFLPLILSVTLALPWTFGDRWASDAPYYQAIATKMVREGPARWWSPMQGNLPYFNKPPLGFWVHATMVKVFGNTDWATHAPEAACYVGVCLLVGWLARRLSGPRVGLLAACAMALTNEWIWRVGNCKLDSLHVLLLLGAMACWARAFVPAAGEEGERRVSPAPMKGEVRWCLFAGLCIGVALMTKPFTALLLPVMGALWLGASGLFTGRRMALLLLSDVTGALLAAPWHLSMRAMHGEAFVGAYFNQQTVQRAIGEQHDAQPWDFYLRLIAGTAEEAVDPWRMWPIYALAFAGIVVAVARWRGGSKRAGDALAVLWTIVWLVGLSVFGGKRNYYLMVVHPGTAWLAGIAVDALLRAGARVWSERVVRIAYRGAATLGVLACVLLLIRVPHEVGKAHRELPVPDRDQFMEFLRGHKGEVVYDCGITYRIASLAYIEAGVWPRSLTERTAVLPDKIEPGALMCFRADMLAKGLFGTYIDPLDEQVFKSSPTGQYMVYRRHGTASGSGAGK